jgi:amino acid transporter
VKLFSAIALLAVANGALINMIMASRLVYGMSRQGIVPRTFGRTLAARQTPHIAIFFTTILAMALILTGDLSSLADTTVILLLGVFVIVNATVLVLRRDPVDHDHFTAPTFVPVLGGLVALYLLYDKLTDDSEVFVRALLLLALGAVLWAVNRLLTGPSGPLDVEELAG